jgi:hypothetical protein
MTDEDKQEIIVTRWALTNGNGYNAFPDSEDDLRRGLAELDVQARQESRPRIAVLTPDLDADDVPYLSVGLGSEDSVLVYEDPEGPDGGYSQGPRTGDDTPVTFAYGTGPTEYLNWMLIPKSTAIAAAVEFYRTGKRPTAVQWTDL